MAHIAHMSFIVSWTFKPQIEGDDILPLKAWVFPPAADNNHIADGKARRRQ